MADEMDEARGKKDRDPARQDQSAEGTKGAPDGEGTAEMSALGDRENAPVSAADSAKAAGEPQVAETPGHATSSAVPQADGTPATPDGSAFTASHGAATPAGRGEPSKTAASSGDSSQASSGGLDTPGLELLYDVELDATLQFGSKEMLLRDVLELGPGDVVELDRHIAEPVDLVVGDRIVARGEVVVASGNFALRVTEVATPQMRLESIRCLF